MSTNSICQGKENSEYDGELTTNSFQSPNGSTNLDVDDGGSNLRGPSQRNELGERKVN